ncbi:B12-binding domain-containing radical SAM protein [Candidatus Magnetaquiglobus chichijimensis]|uniref:B12-binding domain-containing radical SAM protein n=1 Tax=Candidatus Magnetaquiglobus chichijimensis TaxID=3141448 RepID=UPI003B975879
MKLSLLYVGSTLNPYGFRKIGAVAKEILPDTRLYFVMQGFFRSFKNIFKPSSQAEQFQEEELQAMAQSFRDTDILGIATMSTNADSVKALLSRIRRINPEIIIVWGGVHAIYYPDDAIEHADVICYSEGELAFQRFLRSMMAGEGLSQVPNIWYREQGVVIKNPHMPLLTTEQMSQLPFISYGVDDWVFDQKIRAFRPIEVRDYLDSDALSFKVIWTRGCPFKCTYCANSELLKLDKGYARIRHPSVDYLIGELRSVLDRHPYIQTIHFLDDCFLAVPADTLQAFVNLWIRHIKRPFVVSGITPVHADQEKMDILLRGGLNRVRMGVQSGSDRVLKFFKRPNRPGLIKQAADIVGGYGRRMIPPAYDLLVDIPVETQEDIHATIRLVNDFKRPFTINFHSLRSVPNSALEKQLQEMNSEVLQLTHSSEVLSTTFANAVLMLIATFRIPDGVLKRLLPHCKPSHESSQAFGLFYWSCRTLYLGKRLLDHLRFFDFSVVLGRTGWWLWRLGLLKPASPGN